MSGWRERIRDIVEQNMGEFSETLADGDTLIVRAPSRDMLVPFFTRMLQTLRISESLFRSVTVLSETWLHETIKLGKHASLAEYNLGNAFRVYSQGNKSAFVRGP